MLSSIPPDAQRLVCEYLADEKRLLNELVNRNWLPPGLFENLHILIYGQVQSGKTKTIIECVKQHIAKQELCVIVMQNSLAMMQQYAQRLTQAGIVFGILNKQHPTLADNVEVVLLINNQHRYRRFKQTLQKNKKYVLFCDEYDLTCANALAYLTPEQTYYISATPNTNIKSMQTFDTCLYIQPSPDYNGIVSLQCHPMTSREQVRDDFLRQKNMNQGILLVNDFDNLKELEQCANEWANELNTIPIVVITMHRYCRINRNRMKFPPNTPLSEIMDVVASYSHIVIFALRLASRGLSYVTSDYSRHITHQIVKDKPYINYIQSMRILGNYKDTNPLHIYTQNPAFFEKTKNKWEHIHNSIIQFNI